MTSKKTVKVHLISKKVLLLLTVLTGFAGPGVAVGAGVIAWRRFSSSTVENATVVEVRERTSTRQTAYCPTFRLASGRLAESIYCAHSPEFSLGQSLEVRVGDQVLPNTRGALLGDLLVALGASVLFSFIFVSCVLGWKKRFRLERAGKVDADGCVTLEVNAD